MDADFGEKLQDYLTNGPPINGDFNGFIGEHLVDDQENKTDAEQWNDGEPSLEVPESDQAVPQENNIPVEIAAAS